MIATPNKAVRLDLGCGPNRAPSYTGVDRIAFEGVDVVLDLCERFSFGNPPAFKGWPWDDNSIEAAHSSHFVEHLDALERCHFVNELYRILMPKAQALIVVPAWQSERAYGDPTHKWPPVCPFWFENYLNREWRLSQAPHTDAKYMPGGYTCDFVATYARDMNPEFPVLHSMAREFAGTWYVNAVMDYRITLHKKG